MLFKSIGFGGFGLLLGLLTTVFHVNVVGMIRSLYNKVKDMISNGQKVHPNQIDEAVASTIEEHSSPASEQEAIEGYQALQKQQFNAADDGKVYSSLELLQHAKFIRLALIEYEKQNMRLLKDAAPNYSGFLRNFSGTKAKGTSLLGRILGWIFKFALTAAGLLVVGAIADHFMGGTPSQEQVSSGPTAKQTKYPFKNDTPVPNQIALINTPDNIENMLIQFAKNVYSGLDGKEALIKSSPNFQVVKEKIVWQNVYNPGSRTIIIPPGFSSEKKIVDHFIDDVAAADKA